VLEDSTSLEFVALASRPAVARTSSSALNEARFHTKLLAISLDLFRPSRPQLPATGLSSLAWLAHCSQSLPTRRDCTSLEFVALASRPAVARTSSSALNEARFHTELLAISFDLFRRLPGVPAAAFSSLAWLAHCSQSLPTRGDCTSLEFVALASRPAVARTSSSALNEARFHTKLLAISLDLFRPSRPQLPATGLRRRGGWPTVPKASRRAETAPASNLWRWPPGRL
jgi:hypothetical protein